jgi:hypothetical protein
LPTRDQSLTAFSKLLPNTNTDFVFNYPLILENQILLDLTNFNGVVSKPLHHIVDFKLQDKNKIPNDVRKSKVIVMFDI